MLNDYSDILTIQETADVLLIGHNAVYELLRSGELKGFRIGYKWKVPKIAIEELIHRRSGIVNTKQSE